MGRRIKKIVKRTLAAAILLAAAAWIVDWLVLRYRVAHTDQAFGDVEVRRVYAVHLKNRRIEQQNDKPRMEECVRSVFPHYDESPCWYLARHANQAEDLNGAPWHFYYDP